METVSCALMDSGLIALKSVSSVHPKSMDATVAHKMEKIVTPATLNNTCPPQSTMSVNALRVTSMTPLRKNVYPVPPKSPSAPLAHCKVQQSPAASVKTT